MSPHTVLGQESKNTIDGFVYESVFVACGDRVCEYLQRLIIVMNASTVCLRL